MSAPDGDLCRRTVADAIAASRLGPVAAMGGRTLRSADVAAAVLGRPCPLVGAVLLRPEEGIDIDEVRSTLAGFPGRRSLRLCQPRQPVEAGSRPHRWVGARHGQCPPGPGVGDDRQVGGVCA